MSDLRRSTGSAWLLRPRAPLEPSPLSMAISYAVLGFWALVVLFPLYWVFITSFKQPIEVSDGPFYLMWVDFQPSLHAFVAWRALDLGGSAAVAYLLLFVVVFVCLSMLAVARPAESEARP